MVKTFKSLVKRVRLRDSAAAISALAFLKAGNVQLQVGKNKKVQATVLYVQQGQMADYLYAVVQTVWEGNVPEMPPFLENTSVVMLRPPDDVTGGGDAKNQFQNDDPRAHPGLLVRHSHAREDERAAGARLAYEGTCPPELEARVRRLKTEPCLPLRTVREVASGKRPLRFDAPKYPELVPMLVPQEEEVLHALAEEVDYYNSMVSKTPVKMLVFTGEVIWEACAATSLQSAARAYLSRKRMDPCLGHLMARHHAAVRIQRAFRCRYMIRRLRMLCYLKNVADQVRGECQLYLTSGARQQLNAFLASPPPVTLNLQSTVYAFDTRGDIVMVQPAMEVPRGWVKEGPRACVRGGIPRWVLPETRTLTPEQASAPRVLSVHSDRDIGHLLLSYCLLEDVTLKASDEKHHALSLSRPETRAIFASAAEARCRAVMLAALTYDERAACGVALVSLGADVLAIMGVLPHGMDPRALAAAYSAPDKWRLWQVEKRRIEAFVERHMKNSQLRPFVTRMLLEASPLKPRPAPLRDRLLEQSPPYELVLVPCDLDRGYLDLQEASERLRSVGLDPAHYLADAMDATGPLSQSRRYAELLPQWRPGWVPSDTQAAELARRKREELERVRERSERPFDGGSFSRKANERSLVGAALAPLTALTPDEQRRAEEEDEAEHLARTLAEQERQKRPESAPLGEEISGVSIFSHVSERATAPPPVIYEDGGDEEGEGVEGGGGGEGSGAVSEVPAVSSGLAHLGASASREATTRMTMLGIRSAVADMVRTLKREWEESRTNQLVEALAERQRRAQDVREREPLPARTLDVDYLKYSAAGEQVELTAEANARAREARAAHAASCRPLVEREREEHAAQMRNVAELRAMAAAEAGASGRDARVVADAKREEGATQRLAAAQERATVSKERREVAKERRVGRAYSGAFARTLVAFTRRIDKAEAAQEAAEARAAVAARTASERAATAQSLAKVRSFLGATAAVRGAAARGAASERQRLVAAVREEMRAEVGRRVSGIRGWQDDVRGQVGPGGTKNISKYRGRRDPLPMTAVVSLEEARERGALAGTEGRPASAAAELNPAAGAASALSVVRVGSPTREPDDGAFPERPLPVAVRKAMRDRVRPLPGAEPSDFGDTGLGHSEWTRMQDHFATIPGGTSFRRRVERAHMVAGTQDVADPEPRFAQPSSAQPGGAHGAEGGGGGAPAGASHTAHGTSVSGREGHRGGDAAGGFSFAHVAESVGMAPAPPFAFGIGAVDAGLHAEGSQASVSLAAEHSEIGLAIPEAPGMTGRGTHGTQSHEIVTIRGGAVAPSRQSIERPGSDFRGWKASADEGFAASHL